MQFEKKSYWEQKHSLKQFYSNNSDVTDAVNLLADEVIKQLTKPIIYQLTDKTVIVDFLVCGILAFAREGHGYHRQKHPSNLEITTDENNNIMWNEWAWKDVIHTYKLEEMIYVTNYTEDLSFVYTLYKGKLDFFNKKLVLEHVDPVVEVLSNDFLNIDKVLKVTDNIKRSFKLNKIKSEIR